METALNVPRGEVTCVRMFTNKSLEQRDIMDGYFALARPRQRGIVDSYRGGLFQTPLSKSSSKQMLKDK